MQAPEVNELDETIEIRFTKIEKLIFLGIVILLAVVYLVEIQDEYVERNFPFIVPFLVGIHWIFFILGWMLVGFPLSNVLRSIYKSITGKFIPKGVASTIEESRRKFLSFHHDLDMFWWILFLPASFGGLIIASISIYTNLIPFDMLFYVLPFCGAVYFAFMDKFEKIIGIEPGSDED